MQVNISFRDSRGGHIYHYDYKAVPRTGDDIRIAGGDYRIAKVVWKDGIPTCLCVVVTEEKHYSSTT